MEYRIYYRLEEARARLPMVEEKLKKLVHIYRALEFLTGINIESEEKSRENIIMVLKLNMGYHKKLFLYNKYVCELLEMGVIIKDLKRGLVDFYGKHEGRDIYFCWKLGEKDILYWHEMDSGFAGRQSIESIAQKNLGNL